jgi:putative addiction module CopG family antidote
VIDVSTMNVSLPDDLKSFVDERVGHGGFGSTSEYVRDLIRRDQDRERLRVLLLEGPPRRRARSQTARTSSPCALTSVPATERRVAKPVRLRQLAAADLDDASEYFRREAGEQPSGLEVH